MSNSVLYLVTSLTVHIGSMTIANIWVAKYLGGRLQQNTMTLTLYVFLNNLTALNLVQISEIFFFGKWTVAGPTFFLHAEIVKGKVYISCRRKPQAEREAYPRLGSSLYELHTQRDKEDAFVLLIRISMLYCIIADNVYICIINAPVFHNKVLNITRSTGKFRLDAPQV